MTTYLKSLRLPLQQAQVFATADQITSTPVYEYLDGKKTDRIARSADGQELHKVTGVVPWFDGEAVLTGKVIVHKPITMSAKAGGLYQFTGDLEVKPVFKAYGLNLTYVGKIVFTPQKEA